MKRLFKRYWIKYKGFLLIDAFIMMVGIFLCLIGRGEKGSMSAAICLSVGTSVMAAGLVAFLERIRVISVEELSQNYDHVIKYGGIEDFYINRGLPEYIEKVKNATSIDVTGYSLTGFYDNNKNIINDKFRQNARLKVRILLVDPSTEFSKQRDHEEHGQQSGVFEQNYKVLVEWAKMNSCIEIRLIRRQLSSMIYRIDNSMYVGPYLFEKGSRDTYMLLLDKRGWMYKEHKDEFDRMWESACKVVI